MGMILGRDGKVRAVEAATGVATTAISTLYVGLCTSLPSNPDGATLSAITANELTVSANFYTGRKAIAFGTVTVDHQGAARASLSTPVVSWTNTTGSQVTIGGLFVTNVLTGSSGLILWVGTPDTGTADIPDGQAASLSTDDMILKID